jgi:ethanolamine ammonia-lyase small subunit
VNDQAPVADPWQKLRLFTQARIGLGRSGSGVATQEMLAFQLAHARARDAVHFPFDAARMMAELQTRAWPALHLKSAASDQRTYLLRPDLGRRLVDPSAAHARSTDCDLAIVVADGLSAIAVERHALPLLDHMVPRLQERAWRIGPIAVVERGRVAIGDEIGQLFGAKLVAVLIGERPGLSSPDSLGVYLTWQPRIGRNDAERNCISNIRPEGLPIPEAAAKIVHLLSEARRRQLTGVMLKDESALVIERKSE